MYIYIYIHHQPPASGGQESQRPEHKNRFSRRRFVKYTWVNVQSV
jgi:hypothetical protein